MPDFRRYALFYAPPSGSALARFGAAWLGWDAEAGSPAEHPAVEGLSAPIATLTQTPRKYGFHGTLRAPVRLAESVTPAAFEAEAAKIARAVAPFEIDCLRVSRLGRFLALTPARPSEPLAALAAACVRGTNALRAPLGAGDLARRRGAGLTERQEALLGEWGYPYVLDEFRFHLTLTGALDAEALDATENALNAHLAPLIAQPQPVREICIFGEAADGQFHILTRLPLTG